MRLSRYLALAPLFAALALTQASAQAFPDKSKVLRMVVPYGAGSATDILARAYARAIMEVSELSVVVDNKPGANAVIGVSSLLASPADGYSMLMLSSSAITLSPFIVDKLPYAPLTDLSPLTGVSKVDLILNLGPSTTYKSARSFLSAARDNPGKYTCASASAVSQIACEFLMSTAKIKLLIVPYKTTAAALSAVASGESDLLITDMSSAASQWQGGRVRPVAVSTGVRMPARPDLPPLSEEGAPGFEMNGWFATYYSARTPPHITAAMTVILQKAAKTKTVANTTSSFAMAPLNFQGPELTALARDETEKWAELIRATGIKLNH